jgi:hypothetical protein
MQGITNKEIFSCCKLENLEEVEKLLKFQTINDQKKETVK